MRTLLERAAWAALAGVGVAHVSSKRKMDRKRFRSKKAVMGASGFLVTRKRRFVGTSLATRISRFILSLPSSLELPPGELAVCCAGSAYWPFYIRLAGSALL